MSDERGAVRYGSREIAYAVRRSARRRKTVEISVAPEEGVIVVAPLATSGEQIGRIVARRAGWIVRHQAQQARQRPPLRFVSGEAAPYLGRNILLLVQQAEVLHVRVRFAHWSVAITVPRTLAAEARRATIQRALARWYRRRAQARLADRVQHWAVLGGYSVRRISVRDQRSRWASCGPDGTLRFNWRVAMLPPPLIDYIIVHELVHLRQSGHGAAFQADVRRLLPDFAARRRALRTAGANLPF